MSSSEGREHPKSYQENEAQHQQAKGDQYPIEPSHFKRIAERASLKTEPPGLHRLCQFVGELEGLDEEGACKSREVEETSNSTFDRDTSRSLGISNSSGSTGEDRNELEACVEHEGDRIRAT